MRIEITLQVDERKQLPYWSAKAIHSDKIFLEVVSQTFDEIDGEDMKRRYQNVCVKMIKELTTRIKDAELQILLHNENNL